MQTYHNPNKRIEVVQIESNLWYIRVVSTIDDFKFAETTTTIEHMIRHIVKGYYKVYALNRSDVDRVSKQYA